MPIRAAPPSGAPPSYARAVTRIYGNGRKSLRPLVIASAVVGFIWAIASAVDYLKDRSDQNDTSKLKVFFLILAALDFVVAGIEVFGVFAAYTAKIPLVRLYLISAAVAGLLASGGEIVRLVGHFVLKTDIINVCVAEEVGLPYANVTFSGQITGTGNITLAEAQSDCSDSWSRETWYDIGILIFISIVSFFFTSVVTAFYHQLLDPSFARTFVTSSSQQPGSSIPLQFPNTPLTADIPTPMYRPPSYPPDGLPGYDLGEDKFHGDSKNGGYPDDKGEGGGYHEGEDTVHLNREGQMEEGGASLEPSRRDENGNII